MLDDNELAKLLFGNNKQQETNSTKTVAGTVVKDSLDDDIDTGYALVSFGDSVVTIPTTVDVREGDSVIVSIAGNDPVVTGTVGGGDRTRSSITAIANYFWHDTSGAHVSTQEYSTEGRNLLATSSGLYICTGSTVESSFTDSFAQIGRDNQSHLTIESKKLAFLTGSATDGAAFKVDTEREDSDGITYDNATISASTENGADFSQLFIESGKAASVCLLASETHGTAATDASIVVQAKTAPDATTSKDTSLEITESAINILHNDGARNNISSVPMIFIGKKDLTVNNSTAVILWTSAAFATEFGHTFNAETDHISVMNANGVTCPAHIQDCTMGANGDLYATFDRYVTGAVSVGYCVMTTTY